MAKPTPVPGIGPRSRAAEVAPRIVRSRLADARRHEDAAGQGDEDAVHDFRVSLRRLRAALKAFGAPREVDRAAKRLQDALGTFRDLQLRHAWLKKLGAPAKPLADADAEALAEHLPHLAKAVDDFRRKTVPALLAAVDELQPEGRLAGRRVRRKHAKQLGKIAHHLPDVLAGTPPDVTHALRIRFKKLRYAAEIASLARPELFGVVGEVVTPLQDALGTLHDADVRLAWAEGFLVEGSPLAKAARAAFEAARADREAAALDVLSKLRAVQEGDVLASLARLLAG